VTTGGNIHATGLVLGRTGVILRGPSGSGKSLLTLALLDEWEARKRTAKLVADDRLDIVADKGRLTMLAPKAIAGLVELRGRGIVERPIAASARIHLVVDLVPHLERMVEEEALQVELFGVTLPRCPVPKAGVIDPLHQLLLIREALRALSTADRAPRQIIS
jgi:serine kinase of HPr protein (carbohydrate metabolism regulator)